MKICIDAGHGKNTAGKRCLKTIDANETREWVLNNRVAELLSKLLENYGCDVLRVDDVTGANDVSLIERVNRANNWKADVYISIHHNAGINGRSGGGISVYYYSTKAERDEQARAFYKELIEHTGLKGNRSTPVQCYPYYVIKNTKMPAFLIENGFMDSTTDTPIILTQEHAIRTASAIVDFLVSCFGLKQNGNSENPVDVIVPRETYYERLGKAFNKCMDEIESTESYKELLDIMAEGE